MNKYLYFIVEGNVDVYKTVQYFDENDKLLKKEEKIMAVQAGDIIGEDTLWFDSNSYYSAKPQKCLVRTFCILNS